MAVSGVVLQGYECAEGAWEGAFIFIITWLFQESYFRAMNLLKAHKKEHHAVAEALLKYETLDAQDFEAIVRGQPLKHELPISDGSNNRNRGYFCSTTAYILRHFYSRKSLFYLFWSSNCNYVIATYYFFL